MLVTSSAPPATLKLAMVSPAKSAAVPVIEGA
jgi:hypothetical protein